VPDVARRCPELTRCRRQDDAGNVVMKCGLDIDAVMYFS
jgi:hypothetical protein